MNKIENEHQSRILDDVLYGLRLQGSVFCRPECVAPWGVSIPAGDVAFFHIITGGVCWLEIPGYVKDTELRAGDIVILPFGDEHVLRDSPGTPAPRMPPLPVRAPTEPYEIVPLGASAEDPTATMICGGWALQDHGSNPFLSALPRLVHVKGQRDDTPSWLGGTLALLESEVVSSRPGADGIVTRLSEVIFIQALRSFLECIPGDETSWINALADGSIATAVGMMIHEPARSWTVPELARACGMSRSAFATRFRERTGQTPMQFLGRWRIGRAAVLLRETDASIPDVAREVGYASPVAFAKAFSQQLGVPPGQYRKAARNRGTHS